MGQSFVGFFVVIDVSSTPSNVLFLYGRGDVSCRRFSSAVPWEELINSGGSPIKPVDLGLVMSWGVFCAIAEGSRTYVCRFT